MTEGTGAKDAPHPPSDKEPARSHDLVGMGERERQAVLDWVGENLTQVRRSVYEQRLLHWSLGTSFVVGLAVHVGGYALGSSVTTEPLVLVADLLYALGYALWTGVVVAVFVQVFPEATVVAGELPSPRQVLPPLSRELPRLRLQLATAARRGCRRNQPPASRGWLTRIVHARGPSNDQRRGHPGATRTYRSRG